MVCFQLRPDASNSLNSRQRLLFLEPDGIHLALDVRESIVWHTPVV